MLKAESKEVASARAKAMLRDLLLVLAFNLRIPLLPKEVRTFLSVLMLSPLFLVL